MIVVDSSAVIAILLRERESAGFAVILSTVEAAIIGAPTLLETYQVAKGKLGDAGRREVDALVRNFAVKIESWTAEHLVTAANAFDAFGKGSGHPAKLNFGDCMSYALAKSLDAPLLYKGDDFAKTDIRSAATASA